MVRIANKLPSPYRLPVSRDGIFHVHPSVPEILSVSFARERPQRRS
jgi:hypothetical protein